ADPPAASRPAASPCRCLPPADRRSEGWQPKALEPVTVMPVSPVMPIAPSGRVPQVPASAVTSRIPARTMTVPVAAPMHGLHVGMRRRDAAEPGGRNRAGVDSTGGGDDARDHQRAYQQRLPHERHSELILERSQRPAALHVPA